MPSAPPIHEPARETPVAAAVDLCVIGGSCTGVFAAVRAARLGLSVTLVEQNTILGGTATAAQVNEWHSLRDSAHGRDIIGGLTREVVERLRRRGAIRELPPGQRAQFRFNSAELAAELDALAAEHRVRIFLAARCVAAGREGARVTAAILEDRSGRRAIRARMFIDASGDGTLLRAAGFAAYQGEALQPVTYQALTRDPRLPADFWPRLQPRLAAHGYPLANGKPWFFDYPGAPELSNVFGPRLNGIDASDGDAYTAALIEGRRLHRALLAMIREEFGETAPAGLVAWPHALGVRQTWQAHCLHQLTGEELLRGEESPDAIAAGTYPVDIHSADGTTLRYLDGREEVIARDGTKLWRRWRAEGTPAPACYHIPYRSLLPLDAANLLVAGRLFDADRDGFGAARVMVNMNQTGEAAGVAAALTCRAGAEFPTLDPVALRRELNAGGSLLP